jgi:hypothetical protein
MKSAQMLLCVAALVLLGGCIGPFRSQEAKNALTAKMLANPPPGAGRYWRECVILFQDTQPCTEDLRIDREEASMGTELARRRALERAAEAESQRKQRDSEEVNAALAQLGSTLGGAQAKNAPRPQGQSNQPAQNSPMTMGQNPSINNTTVAGTNSESAMQCVSISRPTPDGWARIRNVCTKVITVRWCYTESTDCKNGTWGYTNAANISAGGAISASTFIGQAGKHGLAYAACTGRDVNIQETGPKTFICK